MAQTHVGQEAETDGLIGNGSKSIVKLDVWEGKITQLEKVCVVEHVVYESNADDRSVF